MAAKQTSPVILWFRQDLRLGDHRALHAALATGRPVLPVYILDDEAPGHWKPGAASRWWLNQSLASLAKDLDELGAPLVLRRGSTLKVLPGLISESGATGVYCSRCYETWAVALERCLKDDLSKGGVELKRFSGVLLQEPESIRTKAGEPFKVYTPYWNALTASGPPARPLPSPSAFPPVQGKIESDRLADWRLLPSRPDWAGGLREAWVPGEAGAADSLKRFLSDALHGYGETRNRPDQPGTSRLSPHLHFGEVGPAQCWHAAVASAKSTKSKVTASNGLEIFQKELVWREFSYNLLSHWPALPEKPFRKEFSAYPWARDEKALKDWQRGQTGYPFVDAGMRELWHTGWMHNRVRMVAASFLIKHLLINWQDGQAWFWDTLVDADLASNAASWQWVAGSGADAAPYFRIFNPVLQGEKFDPQGLYVRRWVPEIAGLPDAYLHAPWTAPPAVLRAASVTLGKTYPRPIIDHGFARQRALAGYENVKATLV